MGHHHVIASERPVPPTEHLDPVERIAGRDEHGGDVHLVASIDMPSQTFMGRHPRPAPRHRRVARSDGKNLHELSYSGGPPVSHAPHEQNVAPNTNEHTSEWFPDTCVFTVSIENAPLEPASCTIFCSWSISDSVKNDLLRAVSIVSDADPSCLVCTTPEPASLRRSTAPRNTALTWARCRSDSSSSSARAGASSTANSVASSMSASAFTTSIEAKGSRSEGIRNAMLEAPSAQELDGSVMTANAPMLAIPQP